MIKYIDSEEASTEHYHYCEKRHIPYIQLRTINNNYSEIFFNIVDLAESKGVASELYSIYKSYVLFFQVNQSFVAHYLECEPDYFHTMVVKKEHVKTIAEGLFDFIQLYREN